MLLCCYNFNRFWKAKRCYCAALASFYLNSNDLSLHCKHTMPQLFIYITICVYTFFKGKEAEQPVDNFENGSR